MASGGMMRRIADYPMAWVALFAALAGLAGWVAPMPVPGGGRGPPDRPPMSPAARPAREDTCG